MGYQNANLVAVWHGDLPGPSFKVLIRMALSSLDKDNPPRYHAGAGPLLLALGRREVEPDDDSSEGRRAREVNAEMLRRAVQVLRRRGLVTYAVTPVRGRPPQYWLHLGEACKGQRSGGKSPNDPVGIPIVSPNDPVGIQALFPTGSLAPERKSFEDLQAEEEETNSAEVTPLRGIRLWPAQDPDPPPDPEAERARQSAALSAWSATNHLRPVPTDPTTRETA